MRAQRFRALVAAGPRGRAVIAVLFDPDQVWGAKAEHPVGGTIDGRRVRGTISRGSSGWVFTVSPMWIGETGVAVGDEAVVELAPEGPQREDLAGDIAAALAAKPAAAAFFDTLAQFYRRGVSALDRWDEPPARPAGGPHCGGSGPARGRDQAAAAIMNTPPVSPIGQRGTGQGVDRYRLHLHQHLVVSGHRDVHVRQPEHIRRSVPRVDDGLHGCSSGTA